jgi:multidrug efflux pump subunit AcrB
LEQLWVLRIVVIAAGAVAGMILNRLVNFVLLRFFTAFNAVFDWLRRGYGHLVRGTLRIAVIMLLVYVGLIGLTFLGFRVVATGFIPQQNKGYLVVNAQLPDGFSLERTDAVVARRTEICLKDPGIAHTIGVPGYSVLTSNNIPNPQRRGHVRHPQAVRGARRQGRSRRRGSDGPAEKGLLRADPGSARRHLRRAPVDGLGSTGGFKIQVQDREGVGLEALQGAVANVIEQGNAQPRLSGLFSTFSASQPQLYVDVDRVKAQNEGVDLDVVYDTLQTYLGSTYVNDITLYNRN